MTRTLRFLESAAAHATLSKLNGSSNRDPIWGYPTGTLTLTDWVGLPSGRQGGILAKLEIVRMPSARQVCLADWSPIAEAVEDVSSGDRTISV
jgi:hypothetical protein